MAGKKTSVYLNPLLLKLTEKRPQPLTEALYRGLSVTPLAIDDREEFTTHWFCEVPAWDSKFKVLRDHWRDTDQKPVREIYEIEVTAPVLPAAPPAPPGTP